MQADKQNSVNVEALYADLQKRFMMLKQEWSRAEVERQTMRKSLRTAQQQISKLALQNERLTAALTEVHNEQTRITAAKETVMQALGMNDALNLTAVLEGSAMS